jgi:hypothetical protein
VAATDRFIRQWICFCDDKIERLKKISKLKQSGDDDAKESATTTNDAVKTSGASRVDDKTSQKNEDVAQKVEISSKVIDEPSLPGTQAPECPIIKPEPTKAPKINHDWYQTETTVVVEVRVKGLRSDDVTVDISATGLSVGIKLDAIRDYVLDLQLAHPILPEQVWFCSSFCYKSSPSSTIVVTPCLNSSFLCQVQL